MKQILTLAMILIASTVLGQQIRLSKGVSVSNEGLTIKGLTLLPEAGYSKRLKSPKYVLTLKFDLNDIKRKANKKRDSSVPKTEVHGRKWWIKAKKDTVRIRR